MRRGHGGIDTVVDPEADKATDLPAEFVNADELTTDSGRCDFGNVDGCQIGSGTDGQTSDGTTGVDGGETGGASGDTHDDRTDGEEGCAAHETPTTTEEVTERVTKEGTEEGARLVGRYDVGASRL